MSKLNSLMSNLNLQDQDVKQPRYHYINVFKNPGKLPINQIHIERRWRELKKKPPNLFDFVSNDAAKTYFDIKTEIIPALDKRWLPKATLSKFEPLTFPLQSEDDFIAKNMSFLEGLEYLLTCNYHQFWCTILFEPSAAAALQSFLLTPPLPFECNYLESECAEVCKTILNKFLLVYKRLLTFKESQEEYMPESFGLSKLKERKVLTLPVVITISLLYKEFDPSFVRKITEFYFKDATEVEFYIKEVDDLIDQILIILEMIGGLVCGFDESAVVVPIGVEKRPAVFSLSWVHSAVSYLLYTLLSATMLFQAYDPAVEMALNKNFPYRLPFIYVNVYKEIYHLLHEREEVHTQPELFRVVVDKINKGRTEFIEVFHTFVSHCLDQALKMMGDHEKQEHYVETYLKLMTAALEDEYFICDYNVTYSVATQNEMFESCCNVDSTRTQFLVSCIEKLPRNKTLQELSKLKRQTVEAVFRDFAPAVPEVPEVEELEPQPGPSREVQLVGDGEIEEKIRNIVDMFPHLGDGFVLQCLQSYNFSTADVINAILENNLPPHLAEIPFDSIRIPPEPEPEQPVLAYKGKKPQYDDALKLLNDKKDIKEIKNLVLEGIQYNYESRYDDEYDDRDDDDVIPVADNPVTEEIPTFNPNRRGRKVSEDDEEDDDESESEGEAAGGPPGPNRNFCEDPAVLRERREAKFRSRQAGGSGPPRPKGDVVGKPKGQGQEKSTLVSRQKKNANKSSRANHNRKGGAMWKRNKGMIPS